MVRLCTVKSRQCLCHAAAIVQGESRLVLGRPKPVNGAEGTGGVEVDVFPGDVVVVPAGVSHRSLTSSGGYRYIGVYPEVSLSGGVVKQLSSEAAVADLVQTGPKWRNNYCKGEEPMEDLESEIARVEIPEADPVYGIGGPLVRIWKTARQA